ncbi:MAG: pyridoxal-dependent decarboxylase [Saprospiraceae bacterium]
MEAKKDFTLLRSAYDAEAFRHLGHQLIDLLADHVGAAHTGALDKTIPYRSPDAELLFWQDDFSAGTGDALGFFDALIGHSIRLHHPGYIGHQVSVPAMTASLAGLVSDVLSNGTGVYEMGMASNAIERIVTDFTAAKVGYPATANGHITSGGTLANLTALLAARQAKAPTPVWEEGNDQRLAVLVSEEAHYCIDRAVRIMGWGAEGIIKMPVDEQFRLRTDLLPQYYQEAIDKGLLPIAVVGCAGSTSTGSYDDLEAVADFCEQYNLWFHADGAHGGAVVFSPLYRHLAKGMERADSVVIDYHKMLMTPALNTALLFREGHLAYHTFSQRAQYLWENTPDPEWYHSGKRTFECTKLMMSIKVYALLRTYGEALFAENIERLHESASLLANMIADHPDFELAVVPSSNIVNFRFIPCPVARRDEVNEAIRQRLLASGAFYIVQTTLRNERYLRCSVMNPFTDSRTFQSLLEECSRYGREMAG